MAVTKTFERTIPFKAVHGHGFMPLVSVTFFPPTVDPFTLSLIFDTGATQITLHPDYREWFPQGIAAEANVAGSTETAEGTETTSTVEVLGRTLSNRKILFVDLGKPNPMFAGLFGRDCFTSFGFGFWENVREIYVTLKP
ncbi:hypothetical protein [Candidatus Binatus sp.]|jgi:hypothetical protein|uniref:hypothetical protein n=1 Tax=Candidatus Binatus sp. TaxID=2811406 RepID=UPI003BC5C7AB